MPTMPSLLPPSRWPSIQVGDQPSQFLPSVSTEAPSISRRGTARISAIVMSAVSSVKTFGVLVTVMPRPCAAVTSILSTPLPKLAISLSLPSPCLSTSSLIWSVTVGTRISAVRTASINWSCVSGVSSRLSRASNSSRIRVSIESGSLRVTTTRGFFLTDISCPHEVVQTSLTRVFDTALPYGPGVSACTRRHRRSFCGTFSGLSFWLSVLSSRRWGQNKNPEGNRIQAEGNRPAGGLGSYGCRCDRLDVFELISAGDALMALGRFCSRVLLVCLLGVLASSAASAKDATATSGLPVPRYVSLKS